MLMSDGPSSKLNLGNHFLQLLFWHKIIIREEDGSNYVVDTCMDRLMEQMVMGTMTKTITKTRNIPAFCVKETN